MKPYLFCCLALASMFPLGSPAEESSKNVQPQRTAKGQALLATASPGATQAAVAKEATPAAREKPVVTGRLSTLSTAPKSVSARLPKSKDEPPVK